MKKTLALLLAVLMVVSVFAGCAPKEPAATNPTDGTTPSDSTPAADAPDTYTYRSYAEALATNWNPHSWETNSDDAILNTYLMAPWCTMQVLDSENAVYQWIWEAATGIEDVTAEHQDDLTKYGSTLPAGKTLEEVTEGYVYEIALNPDMKWEDGTPINADSYIYSMEQLLNPEMRNYRSNLYWNGESAVAGGAAYYNSGNTVYEDTAGAYAMADLTAGEDGQYVSANGNKMYIGLNVALAQTGGDTLKDYVDAYGDAYFDVTNWETLVGMMDENGVIPLTDENLALFAPVTTGNPAWAETEADLPNYFVESVTYPEVDYSVVGFYKVDDYTVRYVCQTYLSRDYFLTSGTSNFLVYEDLYEAGKDTTGKLVTTDYGTRVENTMSCGPYRLDYMQDGKQMVFVQNENWYGYEKQADGSLVSTTPYEVDGEHIQRYQATSVIIDVMTADAAKQAFLKGELDTWSPSAEDLVTYTTSDQLLRTDETYTMAFFFNCGLDNLKVMDESKGNTNSVVLSNTNFRKAFSLAIDRAEYVTATEGYTPAYALLNKLYYYDAYSDPESIYRKTDYAMQAICNVYGVEYGEGTPYATLEDAYESINGYNLTEAQALMKTACEELVAAGLYKEGDPIHIRIGYAAGALNSAQNQQIELFNKYINAAAEGSGFGAITLEGLGNLTDRYGDVINGEYAIGYGAWGGAAFYPFRNMQVYCDPDNYEIHEGGSWDPTSTNLTLTINGEEVTMSWQDWSNSCVGAGVYTDADFDTKLQVLAGMEENYLELYYRIPLATTAACELQGYKVSYYTDEYNIMYGYGGLELMQFNYSDAEWNEYVASQNGSLNYE